MKIIFSLILSFILLNSANSQEKWNGFELTLQDGTIIKPGQFVKLGLGTGSGGSFNYIEKGGRNKDKKYTYRTYPIQAIKRAGSEKKGYRYIAVIGERGDFKWNVLLLPALESKEITILDSEDVAAKRKDKI